MKKYESSVAIASLLSMFLLNIVTVLLSCCHGNEAACIEYEKQALLTFKEELTDPSNRLSSWIVEDDCCSWEGVVCSNITNHVMELHLQNPKGSYYFDSYNYDDEVDFFQYEMYDKSAALSGSLSPSLLILTQLHFLDLSLNRFEIPFPSFIGSLKSLQHLNLSYVGFQGNIPPQLGNLSNLHTLSVSGYSITDLGAENLQWLTGLSYLEHLDIRNVNLSQQSNWIEVINAIPSLRELHLSSCDLYLDSHLANLNLSFPTVLDLSGNSFGHLIPRWIFGLSTLASLDLSDNQLEGRFLPKGPWNLTSLTDLDLSGNNLEGILPRELFSLNNLISLDLSVNGFNNLISSTTNNMTNLQSLDISSNNLGPTIPDWLYDMRHLKSLNLGGNQLQGAIHDLIANMTSPVDLDLSGNKLTGRIPITRKLCKIRLLDLSRNELEGPVSEFIDSMAGCFSSGNSIYGPIPSNLGLLSPLQTLRLRDNKLNGTLPQSLGQLSNLQQIDLGNNSISGPIPSNIGLLSSLQTLRLRDNKLDGTLPRSLGQLSNLQHIDLGNNSISGPIPSNIGLLSSLQTLGLEGNKLNGTLPQSLGQLSNLEDIDLGDNSISGPIPSNICLLSYLQTLGLRGNKLNGTLPQSLGQLSNLQDIDLGDNSISGPIPSNKGLLSSLQTLRLGGNKLNGTLPPSVGQLSNLQELNISDNMMDGIVTGSQFHNLTNLMSMWASGNSLTLKVDPNWVPVTRFRELDLSSWKLGPQFPMWLHTQSELSALDLSFSGISDTIPSWIWNLSEVFGYLNLSHNQLQGEIRNICCIDFIDLSSNQLNGTLPNLDFGIWLDLSHNSFSGGFSHFLCDHENHSLGFLLLSDNLLSEEMPDCWMNWQRLELINLENNNLTGSIPMSMQLPSLHYLHLGNNSLSGTIPPILQYCKELVTINFAENNLTGHIPTWLGLNLHQLKILNLRSNKLYGELPPDLCHLTDLRVLDVANNNFSGVIPRCFKNFTSMSTVMPTSDYIWSLDIGLNVFLYYAENVDLTIKGFEYNYKSILPLMMAIDLSNNNFSGQIPDELTSLLGLNSLNLSGNRLGGMIPKSMGNLAQLESLDLSRNQLSGHIPSGITKLSFLGFLNLSFNHLSGKIPVSTQMQSFNASSFAGNQLCGLPLTENCTNGVIVIEEEEADGFGVDNWFYILMGLGYVVGFWGVCFTLILKKSWRYAYFRFVDEVWYKVHSPCTKFVFKW